MAKEKMDYPTKKVIFYSDVTAYERAYGKKTKTNDLGSDHDLIKNVACLIMFTLGVFIEDLKDNFEQSEGIW